MADTSDFRNGLTLEWNGGLWTITEFLHVKPGKGPAFVRTKLKNVHTGKVVDNTFRAGEKVQTARIERHVYQFLYEDDIGLHLMNNETYEQVALPVDLAEARDFMKEGGDVEVLLHAETGEYIRIEVPQQIELEVVETDPGLRGDTATGGTKPATLESGAVVNVPLFINEGDIIRVDTGSRQYLTRVTK